MQTEEERAAAARAEVTRRIKTLGAAGKVREAISALAGLSNLGIQPDTRAATALVQACTRDMELAESIFQELFGACSCHVPMTAPHACLAACA